MNVSPRTVKTVKAVKEADPELAEQVKQGKVRLSTAARAIKDKKPVHDIVTDETTVQLPLAPEPVVAKLPTASPWDELEFGPTSIRPRLPLKRTIAALIEQWGYNAVSDAVLEHTI